MDYILSHLPSKQLLLGFHGRFIHTEKTTLSFWEIEEGAILPEHSHPHEQSSIVLEGRMELTIDGQTRVYEPGLVAVIAPHIVHSGRALSACKILDVFCPVREEYK